MLAISYSRSIILSVRAMTNTESKTSKEDTTMTAEEIKKAWNTFKRELKKELPETERVGFYMSVKQIKNNTATMCLCSTISYEEHIAMAEASIKKVSAYESWTPEEKARNRAYNEERIAHFTERLERYGTMQNECNVVGRQIINSRAFQKFANNFPSISTQYEKANGCYYLRVNYQA